MGLLVLHGFADSFVVWLILGDILRYENDWSHAYVDPNKVNAAILIRCSVLFVICAYTTSASKFIKINKTYNTYLYKTNN